MLSSKKIVLLGREDRSTAILYNSLRSEFPLAGVLVEEGESRLKFVNRRVKRLGLYKALGQVAFRLVVVPWLKATSRHRVEEILQQFGLDASPMPPVELVKVRSVNSDDTVQFLQELQPAVVVVSGTRIIAARVLDCVRAVFINMHAGITPLYRGVHGGYWALVEHQVDACGVTVHEVDTGVDTGRILGQTRITPNDADNFVTYGFLQQAAGLPLLKRAIRDACDGQLRSVAAPDGKSRLWTHPTLGQYVYHRVKSGVK
ncbi:MAG TPA: formyl transferase [Candidatus Polarisedimenticolia bacterium]|nr:formyl transferase [Candidatus Polarisedimenticolia bacterium]